MNMPNPPIDAHILNALLQQLELLKQILSNLQSPAKSSIKLGLLNAAPGTIYIYCNRVQCPGALWYTLGEGDDPVELPAKAIAGYLTNLKFEMPERRGKDTPKLHVYIDCGDFIARLECGHTSNFGKGILSAIAAADPDTLAQPITLAPAPGNDDSVLFCNLYNATGQRIFAAWDEQTNWRQVAEQAIANVKLAHPASANPSPLD